MTVVEARPRGTGGVDFRDAFAAARTEEWAEFSKDCGKFMEEIAKETMLGKFTLAELEEEEQSLERLRRWYRDLKARDVLALPEARAAAQQLAGCSDVWRRLRNRSTKLPSPSSAQQSRHDQQGRWHGEQQG